MAETGSSLTRLIVLRGNSGCGKSTAATLVRARLRSGPMNPAKNYYRNHVALIEQDYVRRTLLGEHDRPDAANITLIDAAARIALDAGFDVIVEGMLFAERYATMLGTLSADHRGRTCHWYFDASLPVTLDRHRLRPESADVPESSVVDWYRAHDLLPGRDQRLVPGDWTPEQTAAAIVADANTLDGNLTGHL
jgi:hypothetical protein